MNPVRYHCGSGGISLHGGRAIFLEYEGPGDELIDVPKAVN